MQETHILRFPSADLDLTEVTVKPITLAEKMGVEDKKLDKVANLIEIVKLSTGLTDEQIELLSKPDFNSISEIASKFLDSEAFKGDLDRESPHLLVPIKGDDGAEIKKYSISVPSVKVSRLMDEYDESRERSFFIIGNCTGFSADEMRRLSLMDWGFMMEAVNDFLAETADYFPQKTPKN